MIGWQQIADAMRGHAHPVPDRPVSPSHADRLVGLVGQAEQATTRAMAMECVDEAWQLIHERGKWISQELKERVVPTLMDVEERWR